ncbi:MAG: hypothetical protein MHM6MM_002246 [Cercozoa sp. M6MM]
MLPHGNQPSDDRWQALWHSLHIAVGESAGQGRSWDSVRRKAADVARALEKAAKDSVPAPLSPPLSLRCEQAHASRSGQTPQSLLSAPTVQLEDSSTEAADIDTMPEIGMPDIDVDDDNNNNSADNPRDSEAEQTQLPPGSAQVTTPVQPLVSQTQQGLATSGNLPPPKRRRRRVQLNPIRELEQLTKYIEGNLRGREARMEYLCHKAQQYSDAAQRYALAAQQLRVKAQRERARLREDRMRVQDACLVLSRRRTQVVGTAYQSRRDRHGKKRIRRERNEL